MTLILWLRVIKFSCFFIILFSGPLFPKSLLFSVVEVFGIFIVMWSLWTRRFDKFSLSLNLPKNYRFVAKGIYKYIRFPITTGIFLITFSLVFSYYSFPRFIIWATLCAVSLYYILYKDRLLSKNYNDYSLYKQKTYRIIPFVF